MEKSEQAEMRAAIFSVVGVARAIEMGEGEQLDALARALAETASKRLGVKMQMQRSPGMSDELFRSRMRDPLAMKVDEATLEECLAQDWHQRHESMFAVTDGTRGMTPAQRAAVSAWQSQDLRRRVAAGEKKDAETAISVCMQIDADDLDDWPA